MYGYAGKILRGDLPTRDIRSEELLEAHAKKFIGGTGLGAKFLYEEVPPGVEWSDPENRMIWATGPLGGTKVSSTGTFSVVFKGPMTNLAGASQASGFFGAYLEFAAFDAIIIHGASPSWVYLYIHDGTAELQDATYLLGKDTWETEDAMEALSLPLVELDVNRFFDEGERCGEIRRVVSEAINVLRQGRDLIVASTFGPLMPGSAQAIAAWLGEITKRVLNRRKVSGLVLTGGDTAVHACRAMGATAIKVEGEVLPGIPAAKLLGGRHDGLRIVTKAGGFGDEDAIAAAIRYLREGTRCE